MMVRVKICGITRLEDAQTAANLSVDMLGFNFFKRSPRYITPEAAKVLCGTLRAQLGADCPLLVGLFVNDSVSNITDVMGIVGLDAVQLSGDESDSILKELRGRAFKAIQPMNQAMALDDVAYYQPYFPQNDRLPSLILDAYHPSLRGGTGETASTEIAVAVRETVPRLMLAGGLTPENVAERVAAVQPWAVDVASGVEPEGQPGIKDAAKMEAFVMAARA